MASNDDVKVRISGDASDLDKSTKEAEGFLGRLSTGSTAIGSIMTGVFEKIGHKLVDFAAEGAKALGEFFTSTIDEAAKSETGLNRLGIAVENAGGNFKTAAPIIEDVVSKFVKLTTYTDDDLRAALTDLVTMTGDVQGSLANLGLAADLAAFKQISLEDAAQLVGKAMNGQTRPLKEFGINIAEGGDAVAALRAAVGPFAEREGQTFAGTVKRISNEWGEFKESIGTAILGTGSMRNAGNQLVDKLVELQGWVNENAAAIGSFVDALITFVQWIITGVAKVADFVRGLQLLAVDAAIAFDSIGPRVEGALGRVYVAIGNFVSSSRLVMTLLGDGVAQMGEDMANAGTKMIVAAGRQRGLLEGVRQEQYNEILGIQQAGDAKSEAEDERHTGALTSGARTRTTKITAEEKKLNEALANADETRRQQALKTLQSILDAGEKLRAAQAKHAEQAQSDFDKVRDGLEKVFGPIVLDMAGKTDVALSKLLRDANDLYLAGKLSADQRQRIVSYVQEHQRVLSDMLPGERESADLAKYVADLEKDRAQEAEEGAKQHDKMREQILAAASGAVALADSFGIVSDESAKVLADVVNMGVHLAGALGGNPGDILAVVGSLANVIAGIGGSRAEQIRLAASQKNVEALDRNTRKLGDLDLDASGNIFAAAQKATKAADDAYKKALLSGQGPIAVAKAAKDAFDVSLAKSGVSFADANALFKSLSGHDLARANAQGSLQDLGAFKDLLATSEFGQFGQDFKGQRSFTEASIDINKPDTFGQFGAYAKLFSQFSPGLAGVLGDRTQFNTAEGRTGLQAKIQGLLGQLQAGTLDPTAFGDLSGGDFLDALKTLTGLINSAGDAVGHLTNPDTPVGGQGTTATDTGGQVPAVEVPTLDESIAAQTDVFSAGFGETNDWLAKIAANTAASMTSLVDSTRASLPGSNPRADAERATALSRTTVVGDTHINVTVSGADDPRTVAAAVIEQIDRGMADRYDDVRAASGSAVLP